MEWHDYIAQLLAQESSFDGISLSFEDTEGSLWQMSIHQKLEAIICPESTGRTPSLKNWFVNIYLLRGFAIEKMMPSSLVNQILCCQNIKPLSLKMDASGTGMQGVVTLFGQRIMLSFGKTRLVAILNVMKKIISCFQNKGGMLLSYGSVS